MNKAIVPKNCVKDLKSVYDDPELYAAYAYIAKLAGQQLIAHGVLNMLCQALYESFETDTQKSDRYLRDYGARWIDVLFKHTYPAVAKEAKDILASHIREADEAWDKVVDMMRQDLGL